MSTGYTRQSAANISAGLVIQSADLNAEFNQLQSAFDTGTGHDHSGSSAGTGVKIPLATATSGLLPMANGGTNAALTASNGGILYSTATAGAVLAGTATANKVLVSGSTAAPSWANISSLLTAGTGVSITGTTNATIALTGTNTQSSGTSGATSSTGIAKMAGSNKTITPANTGRVLAIVFCSIAVTSPGTAALSMYYSTGTPPVSGAGVTGAAIVTNAFLVQNTSQSCIVLGEYVTGLSLGTTYWFDVAVNSTGGGGENVNLTAGQFLLIEL